MPGPPPDEFCFDILGIQVFRDSLWVFTSAAREEGNQRLVDVFDLEGDFKDSFYLKFPSALVRHDLGWSLISDEGFLFVPEEDQEGLVSIGKYRILPSL